MASSKSDDGMRIMVGLEVDGEQHFGPFAYDRPGETYETRLERDTAKAKWLAERCIPLIRVPVSLIRYGNDQEVWKRELLELLMRSMEYADGVRGTLIDDPTTRVGLEDFPLFVCTSTSDMYKEHSISFRMALLRTI